MKRLFTVLLAAALLLIPAAALADPNSNNDCEIEIHAEEVNMKSLTDNTYTTTVEMKAGDWFSVRWTEEKPIAALYWEWRTIPKKALVESLNAAGEVVASREYGNIIRFLTVFPEEGVTEIRMTVTEGSGKMAELFAYDEKEVQPKAIVWEDPYDKADLMLVEAHGNDDVLVFGAVLPTYTDRGKAVQVVDLGCDTIGRQRKSSPGSYLSGLRHYKTFFAFKGVHSTLYNSFVKAWINEDPRDPIELVVREIRRCKPEVVVTHDIENGDFNDGAHKLTAEITKAAVEAASDPAQYPASAETYGAWQVKKLYFHMAAEHPITIDFDAPLASFGGRTARELSVEGMKLWDKEEKRMIRGIESGDYAPSDYGLVFSTVGEDVEKNDFLENIPEECMTDYVPPTPSPTPEPTDTPAPTDTPEPTEAPATDTPAPTDAPKATEQPVSTEAPAPVPTAAAKADRMIWILAGVGGAAVLAAALILFARKRK